MRARPSASCSRMLRDESTSTGTMASRDPVGGSIAIGRNRKTTSEARTSTRSETSVPRCSRVSGAKGRRYSRNAAAATAAARTSANHHGIGYAKCIIHSRQSTVDSRRSTLLFRNRLEVIVDLLLICGRRFVVGARREPIFRLLRLQLLRQRGFGVVERLRRLLAQLLPAREVLFERLGAGRREHHALSFVGEAGAAARVGRIVALQLIHQIARFLQLARVLVAQAREVGAAAAAAALPFTRAALLTGTLRIALPRRRRLSSAVCLRRFAVWLLPWRLPWRLPGLRHLLAQAVELFAQLLRARELLGQLPRFGVAAARGRELVGHAVHRAREILLRGGLRRRLFAGLAAAAVRRLAAGGPHQIGR